MKNAFFWNMTPHGFCKNRLFGAKHHLVIKVTRFSELGTILAINSNCNVLRLLVTANDVSIWPILVTLMMQTIRSSETSVLTRATRRHIQENSILKHS
jgi:hypothetical protein